LLATALTRTPVGYLLSTICYHAEEPPSQAICRRRHSLVTFTSLNCLLSLREKLAAPIKF